MEKVAENNNEEVETVWRSHIWIPRFLEHTGTRNSGGKERSWYRRPLSNTESQNGYLYVSKGENNPSRLMIINRSMNAATDAKVKSKKNNTLSIRKMHEYTMKEAINYTTINKACP